MGRGGLISHKKGVAVGRRRRRERKEEEGGAVSWDGSIATVVIHYPII